MKKAITVKFLNQTDKSEWDTKIKFTLKAPVLQLGKDGLELVEKIFPANPFPNARLSGSDKAEENAQIRRIYDVPLWKKGFATKPLLIPMTSFLEPAYWGPDIGTVQEFKVPKADVFFVAGLTIKPRVPATNQDNGFALITHTATEQMLENHQRLVAVLKPGTEAGYLEEMTPEERFQYVIDNRYVDELQKTKDRTMAKGWEKRIDLQEAKLQAELKYREVIEREGVSG